MEGKFRNIIGLIVLVFAISWFIHKAFLNNEKQNNDTSTVSMADRTSQITIGMKREEVINLLGPADWAVLPSDGGEMTIPDQSIKLDLYWQNGECLPVAVDFDSNYQVIGWDEGKGYCGDSWESLKPASQYSCIKPDRKSFCF